MRHSVLALASAIVLASICASSQAQTRMPPAQREPQTTEVPARGLETTIDAGAVLDVVRRITRGCHEESRVIHEIPLIAVFVADDNGSRATAMPAPGFTPQSSLRPWRPRAPYLMSRAGQDYVLEWARRSNRVFANSRATFRFSEGDIAYDRINNTALNAFVTDATSTDHQKWDAAQAFFRAKVSGPSPDPRYAGRLVLLFQWGAGTEAQGPRSSGVADIDSWFLVMPSRLYGGTTWNGAEVPGWYLQAHEFGHFMGLNHPFPDGDNDRWRTIVERLASGSRGLSPSGNASSFPNEDANERQFSPQPTSPDLIHDRGVFEATSAGGLVDRDAIPMERTTYYVDGSSRHYSVAGVHDTPPDLGLGWAPAWRNASPCEPHEGQVNGGAYSNVTNRTNIMSYTICDFNGLSFTPDQLNVIETSFALPHRSYMTRRVRRTIEVCEPLASRIAN